MTEEGKKYKCEECGIVVVVDEGCSCSTCHLVCCGKPMKKVEPCK